MKSLFKCSWERVKPTVTAPTVRAAGFSTCRTSVCMSKIQFSVPQTGGKKCYLACSHLSAAAEFRVSTATAERTESEAKIK